MKADIWGKERRREKGGREGEHKLLNLITNGPGPLSTSLPINRRSLVGDRTESASPDHRRRRNSSLISHFLYPLIIR